MNVLMVCLGNICRSPLAHGILESKAPEDWYVDSAGTSGWHDGERPDTRSIMTAKGRGLNIDQQRSRPFLAEDFDRFDIIFAMDSSNYSNIARLAPDEVSKEKVRLIMNEAYPEENRQVPDPYTGGQRGFEDVYDMLELAIDKFLEQHL
ncbi:MAG: Low molecular weight protein-tyrosine-phosphatase YfkJ [Cryomorphaceae bacterium]|nr:MAG: Low molecular weight protein-tyrosine-phosphatase YfkJ [Cryomorphaceae bacterium]